jgi:hypothetical protein
MRRGLAAIVLALVLVPFAWAGAFPHKTVAPASRQVACGAERRDVKQLLDQDAKNVAFGHVINSTVKKLGRLTRPAQTGPRQTKERRVYRVRVILDSLPGKKLGFKLEENDNDIHLAVRDSSGASIVAEFIDRRCTVGAKRRGAMESARAALVAACGQPPKGNFRELKGSATITGVLFFDFPHHQRGKAPNTAEIHPVLSFTNATCSTA